LKFIDSLADHDPTPSAGLLLNAVVPEGFAVFHRGDTEKRLRASV
jgi:hypothetical protein